MTIAVFSENMIHVKLCAGKLSGFPDRKTSRQHMFVASRNKLLQSYVDQTVTIAKSFQPHLPLYVATVDCRGGDSGMDR
jgi:hypothetical protein